VTRVCPDGQGTGGLQVLPPVLREASAERLAGASAIAVEGE
jgi:hypothetical protein